MAGFLVLEGGAEFGGKMAEPDRQALMLAGGPDVLVRIIPTAAAADNNQVRAGNNGVRWFQGLGARNVSSLPLIDQASANDPALAEEIRNSRLIYMLGGFPGYLGKTLAGSLSLQAMHEAYEAGAVLAGSSAGAMVLCQYYLDSQNQTPLPDLGFLRNTCVLPHHNTFGKTWAKSLAEKLPGVVLLGIDEQTGLIDDVGEARLSGWRVYGKGSVTIYRDAQQQVYRAGETFSERFARA